MHARFFGFNLRSEVTSVNLANDDTNASRSVFILKKPHILIDKINPSMHKLEMDSSIVSSKIIEKVARFADHIFSNIGRIGPASST